ncbi:MAG: alanine racemase [Coprobacillus sp.]
MAHYRDTYALIRLDYLQENVKTMYNKVKKPMMAIIKANAYGHGYQQVASLLKDNQTISMFGVATLKEAIDLRKMNIKQDILVLGAIPLEDLHLAIEYDISLTLFSLDYVKEIYEVYHQDKPLKAHIKIDTGMNRLGIKNKEDFETLLNLYPQSILQVDGVFTHFAAADDETEDQAYDLQTQKFYEIIDGHSFEYVHCQNSAAMMYHSDEKSNLCRIGIAMYGIDPAGNESSFLKQVMSLYTKVVMVKKVSKGERIGYGFTYTAKEDEFIATLPIGYADGFIRANQGREVYLNGKYYPIVGRVCMDQMMIKVDESVKVHDKVEIFGEHISLSRMAKELQTIPYEIICLLSERVEKVYQD